MPIEPAICCAATVRRVSIGCCWLSWCCRTLCSASGEWERGRSQPYCINCVLVATFLTRAYTTSRCRLCTHLCITAHGAIAATTDGATASAWAITGHRSRLSTCCQHPTATTTASNSGRPTTPCFSSACCNKLWEEVVGSEGGPRCAGTQAAGVHVHYR